MKPCVFFSCLFLATCTSPNIATGCFPEFARNPSEFEVCKTRLCHLILPEPPYVSNNAKLENQPSLPFECSKLIREKDYPGLEGMLFDILDEIASNAEDSSILKKPMCIYGGSSCSFDGALEFVQDAMKAKSTHQFIASGFYIHLPHRRTEYTKQSAAWRSLGSVLMYLSEGDSNSWYTAIRRIFIPFETGAWGVVAGYGLAILTLFIIFVILFLPKWEPDSAMKWFFTLDHTDRDEDINYIQIITWRNLKLALQVFFVVLILLYEIALAVRIFSGHEPLIDDITELQSLDLTKIAVSIEAATERLLAEYVDKQRIYLGPNAVKNPPWARLNSFREMIGSLQSGRVKYVLGYDDDARYWLHTHRLCDTVISIPLGMTQLGGWYYSSAISSQLIDELDRELLRMHLRRFPTFSVHGAPLDCGKATEKVTWRIMFFLLSISVLPLLAFPIGHLVFEMLWKVLLILPRLRFLVAHAVELLLRAMHAATPGVVAMVGPAEIPDPPE